METLANSVAARLEVAKSALLAQMHSLGFKPEDGWRIVEELRHTVDGTEWTFRPMHIREAAPHDLLSTVLIDHEGRLVAQGTHDDLLVSHELYQRMCARLSIGRSLDEPESIDELAKSLALDIPMRTALG